MIIGDTLMSAETAALALELYYQHRPKVPVKAIIFTHSHGDHFGGVKGFVTDEEIESGAVKVYAPDSFTEEAISENVLAGTAMTRRGMYMYGSFLRPGPQGQVSGGLGLSTSHGTSTFAVPTDVITEPVHEEVIDGVRVTFMLAPGTEAPSEMLFYLPDFKALGSAEDVTHTMHNLYTLRGAKTRDAKAWSHYVRLAMELFPPDVEIIFAQHHWPTWGQRQDLEADVGSGRSVQVSARSDVAPCQQGTDTGRDCRPDRGTRRDRKAVVQPWVLRLAQSQRQSDLHLLSRLVRRRSRSSQSPSAGGERQALRRSRRRAGRTFDQGQAGVRRRRLPLGRRVGEPSGVRRSE